MNLKHLLVQLWLVMTVPLAMVQSAETTHDMEVLRQLVQDAVAAGAQELVVPPGVYVGGPREGEGTILVISGAENLHIRATGVTMRCTRLARALSVDDCRRLKLSGLTIDYDPLPFTQGTIIAVAEDGSSVDVKIHPGYPIKAYSRIDIVDPVTRFRKDNMPFLWGSQAELIADDVVRVSQRQLGSIAEVGDLASMSTGPEPGMAVHGVGVSGDSITFEDVTIHSAPGFGLIETAGEGNMHLNRVRVVPGPPPIAGGEARLLSVSWDAIQHKVTRKGPLVENCEIRDAGDDSWSVQCSDYVIVGRTERSVYIVSRDSYSFNLPVGTHLRDIHGNKAEIRERVREGEWSDFPIDAETLDKLTTAQQWTYWRVGKRCAELVLSDVSHFEVGESVITDYRNAGYIFRNNHVHSSGRVLIKGESGIIEGNHLEGTAGIQIAAEVPEESAFALRDTVIRNNTLIHTHFNCWGSWMSQSGSLSIIATARSADGERGMRSPDVIRNMVIENNVFEDSNGVAIVCGGVDGLVIRGNQINGSHQQEPHPFGRDFKVDQSAAIYLDQCANVQLLDNAITDPGPFMKHEVLDRSRD